MVKGSEENSSNGSSQTSMSSHHEISHHNHHGRNRERARGRINQALDHCAPKVDAPLAGCGLYGLTNLKSFSESLNYTDINYCSLAGAWNLIDTPELSVQITNKGGLSPLPKDITATTLVSPNFQMHAQILFVTRDFTFPVILQSQWLLQKMKIINTCKH